MSKIHNSPTGLIGNTPLLRLEKIEKKYNVKSQIFGKMESFNLTGSVKDRTALSMIEQAEKDGLIKPGSVIIEPTSGNTGIALSAIGATKGYEVIIVMPETFSYARRMLIRSYGAQIVLTEGSKGMKGAIEKAKQLAEDIPGSFIPMQFDNPANPEVHYRTTGPEIWRDTDGKIDCLIAGVGTGGTITGTGRYLKEKNPNIKIIAVEPDSSPVLSGGEKGAHKIQGIGAGFIPSVLDTTLYDEVIRITDKEALETTSEVNSGCGISIGISSGAAVCAALKYSKRAESYGKNIVVIMPDSGDRYLPGNEN